MDDLTKNQFKHKILQLWPGYTVPPQHQMGLCLPGNSEEPRSTETGPIWELTRQFNLTTAQAIYQVRTAKWL